MRARTQHGGEEAGEPRVDQNSGEPPIGRQGLEVEQRVFLLGDRVGAADGAPKRCKEGLESRDVHGQQLLERVGAELEATRLVLSRGLELLDRRVEHHGPDRHLGGGEEHTAQWLEGGLGSRLGGRAKLLQALARCGGRRRRHLGQGTICSRGSVCRCRCGGILGPREPCLRVFVNAENLAERRRGSHRSQQIVEPLDREGRGLLSWRRRLLRRGRLLRCGLLWRWLHLALLLLRL